MDLEPYLIIAITELAAYVLLAALVAPLAHWSGALSRLVTDNQVAQQWVQHCRYICLETLEESRLVSLLASTVAVPSVLPGFGRLLELSTYGTFAHGNGVNSKCLRSTLSPGKYSVARKT